MSFSATTADEFDRPRITPAVQWLIALNVAIFFLQSTVIEPGDMQRALGFQGPDLPQYWWKAFSYMFVHAGLLHLLGNMYMLWLFGTRVEHRWSPGAFARYYVLCGLGAALTQVLLVHDSGLLLGASGAVYAVMLAYAMNWPHEELLLFGVVPIKVKHLVAAYVVYDVVMGWMQHVGGGDGVAHVAHLGGLASGWLLLRVPSARRLERVRQRVSPVPDVPDEATPPRAVPRSLPRPQREPEIDDVVAKSKAAVARRPVTPPPPAPRPPTAPKPARNPDDLDLLLDKISEQGIQSLTADERQTLEAASRRLRETT
jgi:membrane associated rhomboid family serine protease